jgi:hypothetical protein
MQIFYLSIDIPVQVVVLVREATATLRHGKRINSCSRAPRLFIFLKENL